MKYKLKLYNVCYEFCNIRFEFCDMDEMIEFAKKCIEQGKCVEMHLVKEGDDENGDIV